MNHNALTLVKGPSGAGKGAVFYLRKSKLIL